MERFEEYLLKHKKFLTQWYDDFPSKYGASEIKIFGSLPYWSLMVKVTTIN